MSSDAEKSLSRGFVLLMAVAVGMVAANLYYTQPVVALIAASLNLAPKASGLIVTLTQLGYGFGVLFLVPLGDLIENKKLILSVLGFLVISLLGLGLSQDLGTYLAAAFAVGLCSSSVQIIVPYVAHLVPDASRGRVVGSLMSGLMMGIMLSRPVASLLTDLFSWHSVFYVSAAMMLLLALSLTRALPDRKPDDHGLHYFALIASMPQLLFKTRVLYRRALYQGFMFGGFCLFWTTVPLYLSGPQFQFSQKEIAVFALAGIAGAVAAPFAGRAADKGKSQWATGLAMVSSCLAFLLMKSDSWGTTATLAFLVLGANLLDGGVSSNLVLGQRAIFVLDAKNRSRMNGLYIATIFVGGALGSSIGVWSYNVGGWAMASWIGFAFPMCALIYFVTEFLNTKVSSRGIAP
jgi:predicted MFS family arabinose efflux permease